MLIKTLHILTYIAIFQSIVLVINLFLKKGDIFSRNILIALFLSFAIFLSGNVLQYFQGFKFNFVLHILNLFVFLSAPLLYFYFLAKIDNKANFNLKDFIHFIPFCAIFVIVALLIITLPRNSVPFNNYGPFIMGLLFIQNVYYLHKIRIKLNTGRTVLVSKSQRLYGTEATTNSINFEINRLQKLLVLFLVVLLIKTGFLLICRVTGIMQICIIFTGIFFIITFFIINNIVIFGLSKSTVFDNKVKYQSTTIKKDLKVEYLAKLENAILKEKVYIDPLLTLEKLSRNLKIPKNYLSLLINENYALNFNEFINQLRINDAKTILGSGNGDLKIIDIAYQVGFNSKSTFNTAFKRYTGETPSVFISRILKDEVYSN
jgi:AraC-like DNA-binding protein